MKLKNTKAALLKKAGMRILIILLIYSIIICIPQAKLFAQSTNDVTPPTITCIENKIINLNAGLSCAVVNYMPSNTIRFSESFINMSTPSIAICSAWSTFRSQLVTNSYTKVTMKGSLNTIGISMTDPSLIAQLAKMIRTGTEGSVNDGLHIWYVGKGCNNFSCISPGQGIEVRIDEPDFCQCTSTFIMRPDIGNENWGGLGGANCFAPSQIMTLEFEVNNESSGLSVSDNSSGPVTIAQIAGLPSGSCFPVGTTINTFVATDPSGNSSSCSFNVTVTDNEAPSIICAANKTQTVDAGVCTASVTVATPVTNDNCGILSIINDYNNSSNASGVYPTGTTIITWKVTDIHGNSST